MSVEILEMRSPVGKLVLAFHDGVLSGLGFEDRWDDLRLQLQRRFGETRFPEGKGHRDAVEKLRAYLEGDVRILSSIPADPGGTPFQAAVWKELRKVPPGRTASYQDLARAVGRPRAVRAVGAANGANPIAIVIPCHRVVRADGELGGYGGGRDRKRWLLGHEGALPSRRALFPERHTGLRV